MGRIYEVNEFYHIDLAKIVSVRQFIEKNKKRTRNESLAYNCWIELSTDRGSIIIIDSDIKRIKDDYSMLIRAWRNYVGDDTPATLIPPYSGETLANDWK